MERKKVLVLGGTGYLGQHLLQGFSEIKEQQQPYYLAFTHHSALPPQSLLDAISPSTAFHVDLQTGQGLDSISTTFGQPHVIVNCAALSVPRACETDPTAAMAINVPSSVVKWLSSFDESVFLIHLSTDQVYEGVKSFYKEEDETVPVNVYGKSKVAAEQFISTNCSNFAILRSSIIYGPQTISPVAKSLPIQWIDSVLFKGDEVEFFHDEFRCPVFVKDVVNIILALINRWISDKKQMKLLLNVGGPDRVSRMQMAEAVATVRGYSTSLIKAVSASSVNRGVNSPADISMDISRLVQTLGITPTPFIDGVKLTLEVHMERDNEATPVVDLDQDDEVEKTATPLKRYVTFITNRKDGNARQKSQGVQLCPKVTKEERERMKKEEDEAVQIFGARNKAPPSIIPTIPPKTSTMAGKKSVVDMFKKVARNDVDSVIASFFYTNGISFNVARSPFWVDMVRLKDALIGMVSSEEWEKIKSGSSRSNVQHEDVKRTILDDDFWQKTRTILTFVKPIWEMIRFCDSDRAVIGEVYQLMEDMLGSIKEELSNSNDIGTYHVVEGFVLQRWEKMNLPLHGLAYVLTPFYYSKAWLTSLGPGGERRKKPHADHCVGSLYLDAVDRIVKDPREQMLVRAQLSDFVSNKGIFGRSQAINDRQTLSAIQWWDLYGVVAAELYNVAVKVLSQSVNTSCAERALNTYGYINSVKRNRMNTGRAESLVYVHYNHRLLSRYREDYEVSYKNWDSFADDDNLDNYMEAIEEREHRSLHEDGSHDGRPSFAGSSFPTQGLTHESSPVQEQRRQEIIRGKRKHKE
ncbi:dTDP-4-dehydrorhamnose reductase [Macleaya cordata]|uniref:dTDP-4-dehydrorhamnose reductase n=1 Tax=Macleaya cordata TaxID=56857 RepID=A0A200QUJ0_MACCD|nr:dTDP-4-dehydrorhamnose reductase [Macleaya cordata]